MRSTLDIDKVRLTFDDGPSNELTIPILELLARYQVSATFFVRGEAALQRGSVIERVAREGHEVANHTMTHRDLTTLSDAAIEDELARTNTVLEALVGKRPRYFRPPFGRYDDRVLAIADRLGLETLLWSVSPEDWSCPGVEAIVAVIVEQARPGAILLFHDGCGHLPIDEPIPEEMRVQVLAALPTILETLRARNLLRPDA